VQCVIFSSLRKQQSSRTRFFEFIFLEGSITFPQEKIRITSGILQFSSEAHEATQVTADGNPILYNHSCRSIERAAANYRLTPHGPSSYKKMFCPWLFLKENIDHYWQQNHQRRPQNVE
jgi:hypothetical protein